MAYPTGFRRFLLFLVLSSLFVLSQFYRVSNAVIAPNLIQDLRLNAEMLGLLGGAFFYAFTLLQIPMGPMLDRIGPRWIMSASCMIGATGAVLFSFGEDFPTVLAGRILIGAGMAPMLMGAFKAFTLHFPPNQFATLVGMISAVGTLGNIFAASPLAYFTSAIGWRKTFFLTGLVTLLLGFLIFWALRTKNGEGGAPSAPEETGMSVWQSIRLILRSLAFWQLGVLAFFRYGTFVSLQGLWLGPYLISIKGFSPLEAGNLIILLAIGIIAGSPIGGRLSDRYLRSRKGVALTGLSLYCLSLLPLSGFWKIDHPILFGLILFSIGFFHGFGMLIYAHAKDLFPITISGTVMTYINFFTMAGAALFMPFLGRVIEAFPKTGDSYPAEAYHLAFFICFLGMTSSVLFYAFSKGRR
ncbi:MAG: MFS transporter [Desulfobacterota bacterium]|nr:MFS transporter [Thermodesulfobacteriota bacterium]